MFICSFSDPGPQLLHLQVDDDNEADLYSKLQNACLFIGKSEEQMYNIEICICSLQLVIFSSLPTCWGDS